MMRRGLRRSLSWLARPRPCRRRLLNGSYFSTTSAQSTPLATQPTPSPSSMHTGAQDSGQQNQNTGSNQNQNSENKDEDHSRNSKTWVYFTAAFPFMVYWWERRSERVQALEEIKQSSIGCDLEEIKALIRRTEFTITDTEEVYQAALAKAGGVTGSLDPDAFGTLIFEQVQRQRERTRQAFAGKQQEYATAVAERRQLRETENEAKREELERAADAAVAVGSRPAADKGACEHEYEYEYEEVWDHEEEADLDDLDKGETEMEKLINAKFVSFWEVLCLYRHFQLQNGQLPLRAYLTGLSQITDDYKPKDEWVGDPKKTKPQFLKYANRDFRKKFLLALLVNDGDSDGYLSKVELTAMLQLMINTGHVDPESLLRQSSLWPIQWRAATAEEIADRMFSMLKLQSHECISYDEIIDEAVSMSEAREAVFWYVPDQRKGFFRGFYDRSKERLQRLAIERGYQVKLRWDSTSDAGETTDAAADGATAQSTA